MALKGIIALLNSARRGTDLLTAINNSSTTSKEDNKALLGHVEADTWSTTIGNSKTLTYYIGAEAGHPSTSTDEVKTIVHKKGTVVSFTQTLTYDANNNVLTIVTT